MTRGKFKGRKWNRGNFFFLFQYTCKISPLLLASDDCVVSDCLLYSWGSSTVGRAPFSLPIHLDVSVLGTCLPVELAVTWVHHSVGTTHRVGMSGTEGVVPTQTCPLMTHATRSTVTVRSTRSCKIQSIGFYPVLVMWFLKQLAKKRPVSHIVHLRKIFK